MFETLPLAILKCQQKLNHFPAAFDGDQRCASEMMRYYPAVLNKQDTVLFFRQGNSRVHAPMGGVVRSDDRLSVVGPIALVRHYCTYGFFSEVTFAAKQRELPQQLARRDLFPGHVLGNCKANDVTGSGNIVQ
jgi:hypothetical protein